MKNEILNENNQFNCGCIWNMDDKFVEKMCEKHEAEQAEGDWDREARYLDSM